MQIFYRVRDVLLVVRCGPSVHLFLFNGLPRRGGGDRIWPVPRRNHVRSRVRSHLDDNDQHQHVHHDFNLYVHDDDE